jgi:hypothetical protein
MDTPKRSGSNPRPVTEVTQDSDVAYWMLFGTPDSRSNLESESKRDENAHASSSRKSANSLMHERACTTNNTEVEHEIMSDSKQKCGDSSDEGSNDCLDAEQIMVPSGEYLTGGLRTKSRVS